MVKPEKKYAVALDPIHIGAGGYQLGRVDNVIVREPATGIPKIPGTSIAGAVRSYAVIVDDDAIDDNNKFDIDAIFGTVEGQGMLRFYDGQILFFPVNSMQGTVWVTTKELLEYWFDQDGTVSVPFPETIDDDKIIALKGINGNNTINLGWLLLKVQKLVENKKEIKLPDEMNKRLGKIIMVSQKLFTHIVNDNLEVRTSVRIDPETGAAEKTGLFTYEAMPRGTVIGFEICCDERRGKDNSLTYDNISPLLSKAYNYLKMLGIGGMETRGFGRLEVLKGDEHD